MQKQNPEPNQNNLICRLLGRGRLAGCHDLSCPIKSWKSCFDRRFNVLFVRCFFYPILAIWKGARYAIHLSRNTQLLDCDSSIVFIIADRVRNTLEIAAWIL